MNCEFYLRYSLFKVFYNLYSQFKGLFQLSSYLNGDRYYFQRKNKLFENFEKRRGRNVADGRKFTPHLGNHIIQSIHFYIN